MYLMNVPPVAPIHTEWRTCGPPRGFSLPLCFNDSDSDLSSTGTPIPEKVQMIIESLRSTQSSLEMGDEVEGNVLSAQEARPQGCKARRQGGDPMAGPKPKCRGSTDPFLPEISSPVGSGSQESDSDDSVDRGIEEAIQEYLKEKDGCKRKAELATNVLQPSKIPRTDQTYQDNPKQYSESNKVLTASNQAPKILKAEAQAVPLVPSLKKLTKSKVPLKENPFKRVDTCKVTEVQKMYPGPAVANPVSDKVTNPAAVEEGEDSPDSSSDDGIEEAIQLYQLEKKEDRHEPGEREACKPLAVKEEDTDSSSDDGIEEAIRSYQLEKQNEKKPVLKPPLLKHKLVSKEPLSYPSVISNSAQEIKRNRLSRKKKPEKDVKSLLQMRSPSTLIKNTFMVSHKVKRNRGSKMEPLLEQPTSATLKVATTTTAELMCAEAILDISKAVMPEVFNPNVSLPGSKSPQPSLIISSECQGNESDDSSVDSEDGIEQEIRKFLEQKAQMHKQGPDDSTCASTGLDFACDASGPEGVNKLSLEVLKQGPKKPGRSVTQNKTLKRDCSSKLVSKEERVTDQRIKDQSIPKPLTEPVRSSSPSVSHQRDTQQLMAQSERREQSDGDKSSSLDSDEDLDTAIKDLLKTKKKIKKKTRDLKMKSRKGLKEVDTLPSKRLPAEVISKPAVLKSMTANTKGRHDSKETPRLSKSTPQHKQLSNKRKDSLDQASETGRSKGNGVPESQSGDSNQVIVQIKEDSSSVDSDDSIELEIRKFLAEKAKVCTPMGTVGTDEMGKYDIIAGTDPLPEKDIKLENQLAEIPKGDHTQFLESHCSPSASVQKDSQDGGISLNTSTASPAYSSSATNLPRSPCFTPAFTHRSSPLEPADGAGPARTQKLRRFSFSSSHNDSQNIPSEVTRCGAVPGHGTLPSTDSDILHESQAIPPTAETRNRIQSPNPFHSTLARMGETAATTLYPYPCGDGISHRRRNTDSARDAPVTVCPSARSNQPIVPFHCSPEMPVSAVSRPPFIGAHLPPTSTRQPAGRYFMQTLVPGGHWGQVPTPGRSQSSVAHVSKDQTTFVPLSASKTNHIQVRSREASKGKDRSSPVWGEREIGRESKKIEGQEKIAGEGDCVDETECESDESRSPVKKQGFSTLSLSKAIDPGGLPSPYIALNTEERSQAFHRRCMALKGPQEIESYKVIFMKRNGKPAKRQLKFLPSSRETIGQ
ncbi:protein phosphatase 1 regulatory subunit 26 [Osmerus eperlanus]|uniref:protein phosphatase 1 regulatory subunit 26 n=1 Tax=Osmerus eperlanus TaxID=29151 RepID=UPI002E0DBAAD